MKRFLVTGGCGFIGSNFLHYFLNAHPDVSVVNLDKLTYAGRRVNTEGLEQAGRYQLVHGDVCDRALVKKLMSQADWVIHFAAESHVDRSIDSGRDFVMTNVLGTEVLLDSARQAGIKKFIHFSTDEVYGSCRKGSFDEDAPLHPSSPYSASKAASDLLALAHWKTHELPVVIIRATNNFGPYQYPEKVIPLFITNLIEGKKVPLYAKGENVRDWLYVGDAVRGVDFILQWGVPGEIYHLGGGSEVTNLELTKAILKAFGKAEDSIQYVKDRPAHDFRYSLNTTKLKKLGFSVVPQFQTRLEETIEWYRSHTSWWRGLKSDLFTLK